MTQSALARRPAPLALVSGIALIFTSMATGPALAATGSFSQTTPIIINDDDAATAPYPSNISVAGLPKGITDLNVSLSSFDHTFPDDVDVLLAGPGGQAVVILSDAGGGDEVEDEISGVNLTLDDQAATQLPDETTLTSGTYRPTNYEDPADDVFPPPAPAATGTTLSAFNNSDPNGTWRLFVFDDGLLDVGDFDGWSLQITTVDPPAAPVFTAPASNPSTERDGDFILAGTARAGSTVRVFEGATQVGSTTATSGSWAVALVDVPDGTHTYTATTTDGFGNTSTPSASRTVTVDTVHPRVTRTRPVFGADGVRLGRNIRATFSEAVRPGTLTKANVRLVNTETGNAVRARRTYNATTHTVVINPRRDLAADTRYRVVIGTGVKDVAGNRLDQKPRTGLQPKTWRFTTR